MVCAGLALFWESIFPTFFFCAFPLSAHLLPLLRIYVPNPNQITPDLLYYLPETIAHMGPGWKQRFWAGRRDLPYPFLNYVQHPQTSTESGCLVILTVKQDSNLSDPSGHLTVLPAALMALKVRFIAEPDFRLALIGPVCMLYGELQPLGLHSLCEEGFLGCSFW